MTNDKSAIKRTLILETVGHIGEEILIKGWIHLTRNHGKLIFFNVRDRSGMLQVVINAKVSKIAYEAAKEIRPEFAVEIIGKVNKRPSGTVNKELLTGEVEIEAKKIIILSKADTLPFDMGGEDLNLELPTLLDHRSLTLRHPKIAAIFKIQELIVDSFRKVSKDLGCTEIFVPTISASSTEGGAEVFKLDYYGHNAYLTQSPQLYKQMMVPVFERVFTISHAYRSEPSITTRHLAEVTQMDCEFGFVDFDNLLDLLEKVASETLSDTAKKSKEIKLSVDFGDHSFKKKIPRLTLQEAHEIIYKTTGCDNREEPDLSPQGEIDICRWAKKEYGTDLVTITHFPTKKRAFYTMPDPKNPKYSLSYDILFRGLEIASGSQRINDYNQLISAIKSRNLDPKDFAMYLMAFKYGMPKEGGFSFGLERMTMKLLGLSNIREASLFPRDMERVDERFSKIEQKNKKTPK